MPKPAISIDPKTGRKIFNTRAAKAYQIADIGLSVNLDPSLTRLPELDHKPEFNEAARAQYNAYNGPRKGAAKFVDMEGPLEKYLKDPYSEPPVEREALKDECDIVVVGAGLAGVVLWYQLREAGFEDVRFCDMAGDVGGTWYWNRYPGVACDIESYTYMPLLDEMEYVPTMKFASGFEIQTHFQRIAERTHFYDHALFHTTVTEANWDEKTGRWTVITDRGDAMRARFVILANGLLTSPKLPQIKGMEDFKGASFHTSRWRYDVDLKGKRVGVIGTGASAVQVVPEIAKVAKELYVFQRTATTIDTREQRETTKEEYEKWRKQPGWAKQRRDRFAQLANGRLSMKADDEFLSDLTKELPPPPTTPLKERVAQMLNDDYVLMERIRARVDAVVQDKDTAQTLKPFYNWSCKRPTFHDEYLPTFNQPHVHLVDCSPGGVETINARGVVHDGKEYPIDVIIYATGFEFMAKSTFAMIRGRDGQTLKDKYDEQTRTFLGLQSHGYPNLFFVGGPQAGGPGGYNFLAAVEAYVDYIVWMLKRMREHGDATVDIKREIEDEYAQHCAEVDVILLPLRNCVSYYNGHGTAKPGSLAYYGGLEWKRRLDEARVTLEPYVFTKGT